MSFAFIDILFVIIIVFCVIRCVINGFVKEFFSKVALIAGAFVGLMFYGVVTPMFPTTLPDFAINIAAFLLIFIAVYIIIRIIEHVVGLAFRGEIMAGLDRALGLFLGIFEGLLISGLILLVLLSQTFINVEGLLDNSLFYDILTPVLLYSTQLVQRII